MKMLLHILVLALLVVVSVVALVWCAAKNLLWVGVPVLVFVFATMQVWAKQNSSPQASMPRNGRQGALPVQVLKAAWIAALPVLKACVLILSMLFRLAKTLLTPARRRAGGASPSSSGLSTGDWFMIGILSGHFSGKSERQLDELRRANQKLEEQNRLLRKGSRGR